MKITTRAKKISAYSQVKGLMVVDYAGGDDSFWLKLDTDKGNQYIVELSKFEVAQIINAGLKNAEIVAAGRRQNNSLVADFLK